METRFFPKIIGEVCDELEIKVEKLSSGWILQLSKDGKIRHITDRIFDINPQATGTIVDDKYATYTVLTSQNIPVIKHTIIFNPAIRENYILQEGNWKTILSEFEKQGKLVVKPNNNCEGKGIELCHTLKEVEVAIQKLFYQNHGSVSICPYYDIKTEYRAFYLNGEVLLIYGKTKPYVIGDGKTRLKELVETLKLPDNDIVRDNFTRLDLNAIPKEEEKVELSWKHNLTGGAVPKVLEKGKLYSQIEELAKQAGKAMNMNFTTIDIIQTTDDKLYVMEMNSGVCGTIFANVVDGGYEIMKEIYKKAIIAMFE